MTSASHSHTDIAVIGAGIFGLSVAVQAIKRGLSVVVLEKAHIGAGSSGGVLGALMPHMPARWNQKKQFQFQALSELENYIRTLEAESGQLTGYERCGRIQPLANENLLKHHLERAEEAKIHWNPEQTGFHYTVEPKGSRGDWLNPEHAPYGIAYETLAARIQPKAYLAACAKFIRQTTHIHENTGFIGYSHETGHLETTRSDLSLSADKLVLANGYAAFPCIEEITGTSIGSGEKGQAILLDGHGLEHMPAIYCDGLYVVPHDDHTVAVGSTSIRHATDTAIEADATRNLLERATAFCPILKDRKLLSQWAGIRPRCTTREPIVGQLPDQDRIYTATGGFKISFGIAHLIAESLLDLMTQTPSRLELPEKYLPAPHFAKDS